jgi:hypothetical protein
MRMVKAWRWRKTWALDMHVGQGSERAKALLDSNTRKHRYILEVALVNGVFRTFTLTLRRSEDELTEIQAFALHNAHRSPLFPRGPISARTGNVLLRLVMTSRASTVSTIINASPRCTSNSRPSSTGLITCPFKTSPLFT